MSPECLCGHSGCRHEEEQPYPCHECDCDGFMPDRRTGPKDRRDPPRYDRRKGGTDGE